jgi:hypothetical protein
MFIENVKIYFNKNNVWTNWYDFLGINTSEYSKTIEKWKNICRGSNIITINEYIEYWKNNKNLLPSNPSDYYKNFTSILELNIDCYN